MERGGNECAEGGFFFCEGWSGGWSFLSLSSVSFSPESFGNNNNLKAIKARGDSIKILLPPRTEGWTERKMRTRRNVGCGGCLHDKTPSVFKLFPAAFMQPSGADRKAWPSLELHPTPTLLPCTQARACPYSPHSPSL